MAFGDELYIFGKQVGDSHGGFGQLWFIANKIESTLGHFDR